MIAYFQRKKHRKRIWLKIFHLLIYYRNPISWRNIFIISVSAPLIQYALLENAFFCRVVNSFGSDESEKFLMGKLMQETVFLILDILSPSSFSAPFLLPLNLFACLMVNRHTAVSTEVNIDFPIWCFATCSFLFLSAYLPIWNALLRVTHSLNFFPF